MRWEIILQLQGISMRNLFAVKLMLAMLRHINIHSSILHAPQDLI